MGGATSHPVAERQSKFDCESSKGIAFFLMGPVSVLFLATLRSGSFLDQLLTMFCLENWGGGICFGGMLEGSKEEYRKTQAELMRSKNALILAQIDQLRAKTQKIKAELAERHGLSVDELDEMETELAQEKRGNSAKRSLSKRRSL
jgi:hypothetical protein